MMYVDVRPLEFQFRSSKMKNHEKFRSDGAQKQLALVIRNSGPLNFSVS